MKEDKKNDIEIVKLNKVYLDNKHNSNGAAYGDFDGDGDMDLIVSNIDEPLGIFENQTDENSNFLKVKLVGNAANTNALGAKVSIFKDGKVQLREQFATRGYLSSVSHVLHFGLGSSKKIENDFSSFGDLI